MKEHNVPYAQQRQLITRRQEMVLALHQQRMSLPLSDDDPEGSYTPVHKYGGCN